MAARKPISLPVEEFVRIIDLVGVTEEQRQAFAFQLALILDRKMHRGRRPVRDARQLIEMGRLVVSGQARNGHAAATAVTSHLPESQRAAAHQRLYRKFSRDPELWQQLALEPNLP